MCNSKCCGGCVVKKTAVVLLLIGGLNWGLVGLGMFLGNDLNVVHLALGFMPKLEAIVYLLVGVSAILKIFGCPCKKCKEACAACSVEGKTETKM